VIPSVVKMLIANIPSKQVEQFVCAILQLLEIPTLPVDLKTSKMRIATVEKMQNVENRTAFCNASV